MRVSYQRIEMKATARDSNHNIHDNNLSDNEYYINRLFIVLTLERGIIDSIIGRIINLRRL